MKVSIFQQQDIESTAKKYGLKLVLLFGSQIEGRIHGESDIDIAYLPGKSLDFEQEYRLNYEFTRIFQKDRVDTVDMVKAPPLLFYAIFQHPRVLFQESELLFPTYRAYAFKKYVETKPLYEEKFRRLKTRVNQ